MRRATGEIDISVVSRGCGFRTGERVSARAACDANEKAGAQKNSKVAVSDMGMLGFMSRFWVS
jgi:hypothetical protein